ncbi:MAG: hypothetical protein VR67_05915 [Peptococcaceae bacterium BRH_c8a]|nr:MAG: hypothetical protein VR67_05915 [Peptococcaceae bacterium BRH_c8a]
MIYFTKDWCREMQVTSFLAFPETKEEWDNNLEHFKTMGLDYKKLYKQDLIAHKVDLLKFLPESFHPYIYNETLNSEYPSPELKKMAEQWREDYLERINAVANEYNQYYNSIKETLPENAVRLHENSLHDASVLSFAAPSRDTFEIILDCRGGFHYFTDIKLTFVGVKELSVPDKLEGTYWLYNEVYATKEGFELHVLFHPLTEFTIVAESVFIDELN